MLLKTVSVEVDSGARESGGCCMIDTGAAWNKQMALRRKEYILEYINSGLGWFRLE